MSVASEVATDVIEDRNEAEEVERLNDEERPLEELVPADESEAELTRLDVWDPPGRTAMAAAVLREFRRLELKLAAIGQVLDGLGFQFQWETPDVATDRRAASDELADAGQLLDALRESLLEWFRHIGQSRFVELDNEALAAVLAMRGHLPDYHKRLSNIVNAAVLHLAAQPAADAAAIIAKADSGDRLAGADRDAAENSAGSAAVDAAQELEDIAVEIERRGALPSFVREVRGLAAKYTGDAMDEAETVQRKCEDLATVPDVEDLMYEDAVGKIVAFREHSGWAEDRDLARVTIFIPELSEYRDITCDIDQLYHRNLVGPTGLIEQLVQRVDALCNELDPGGALVPAKADAAGTGGQADGDGDGDGDGDEEWDAGGSGAGNPADTDSTDANADIADAAGGEDASEPEVPEFICKLVDTVNVQVWTKNGEGECILSIAAVIQEDEDLITLSAALTEAVASLDARRTDWLQRNAEALRDSVASAAVGPDEDARPAGAAALRPRASGSDDARAAVLVAEQES